MGRYRRRVHLATGCVLGGLFCSQYTLIKETEITGEICFNIHHHHHRIIITQIVLVIVAAYFIFRVYSCIFTISAAFVQLCALQVCAFTHRIYLNRILICNRSLQIQASDPIEYVERNVKMLFYFSLFMKCKKYP